MRPLHFLLLLACAVGAFALAGGYKYRVLSSAATNEPKISRCEMPLDLTAWTKPDSAVEFCEFPINRQEPFSGAETDAAYVRPAWEMLVGVILLFLWVHGTRLGSTILWHVW